MSVVVFKKLNSRLAALAFYQLCLKITVRKLLCDFKWSQLNSSVHMRRCTTGISSAGGESGLRGLPLCMLSEAACLEVDLKSLSLSFIAVLTVPTSPKCPQVNQKSMPSIDQVSKYFNQYLYREPIRILRTCSKQSKE